MNPYHFLDFERYFLCLAVVGNLFSEQLGLSARRTGALSCHAHEWGRDRALSWLLAARGGAASRREVLPTAPITGNSIVYGSPASSYTFSALDS